MRLKFENAVTTMSNMKKVPVSNDLKLEMYSLYKQSTEGVCNKPSPSIFNPVEKAKWNAWKNLGDMSQESAMQKYCDIIANLAPEQSQQTPSNVEGSGPATLKPRSSFSVKSVAFPRRNFDDSNEFEFVQIKRQQNGVMEINLNRPTKHNAFNIQMWQEFGNAMKSVSEDRESRVCILTGSPHSFSSGMDLSVFMEMQETMSAETCEGRRREALGHFIQFLQDMISSSERSHVPVIAAVAGHCIGGAVDIITACDLRYCTKDASFCVKETDLAMVADIGTLQRLPKLVGDQVTSIGSLSLSSSS